MKVIYYVCTGTVNFSKKVCKENGIKLLLTDTEDTKGAGPTAPETLTGARNKTSQYTMREDGCNINAV